LIHIFGPPIFSSFLQKKQITIIAYSIVTM